jgi:hypothetical protein
VVTNDRYVTFISKLFLVLTCCRRNSPALWNRETALLTQSVL